MIRRKLLRTTVFILATILLYLLGSAAAASWLYVIDPVHSSVTFKVKHFGISNVHGRFNDFSGSLRFDNADPSAFVVSVRVVAGSIDTANSQRDQHLKSPDFLDVQNFPFVEFNSTSVEKLTADTYAVRGSLRLHGVARPLAVKVVLTGTGQDFQGNRRIGFETEFKIKRSDFGMDKRMASAGDEVRLTVSIEGVAQ